MTETRGTVSLADCPALEPLPRQREIILEAIALARGHGLSVPSDLQIFCVDTRGDEHMHTGETTHNLDTGETTVYLDVSTRVFPDELRRTTLHEASHVDDRVNNRRLAPGEGERRAVEFVALVEGWR